MQIEEFIGRLRQEREVILASLKSLERLARIRGKRGRPPLYQVPIEGGTSRREKSTCVPTPQGAWESDDKVFESCGR